MALSYLLDTSVFSQPLKPRPLEAVQRRWEAAGEENLAISAITEAEMLYGIELKQSEKLRRLYNELLRGRILVLPVDSRVAESFAVIKSAARRNGMCRTDFELLIAATARAHKLTVATLNFKDFSGIQGAAAEDWGK